MRCSCYRRRSSTKFWCRNASVWCRKTFMVPVFYMVDHILSTGSAWGAAATGGTAVPKFSAWMHEFDAGRLVWCMSSIWLIIYLLQVVHELQLLQEVQLYQILVQERIGLIREDLHGVCLLYGWSYILMSGAHAAESSTVCVLRIYTTQKCITVKSAE